MCIAYLTSLLLSGYTIKKSLEGNSLVVQWIRLCASTAEDWGWIPGWGTRIPHAAWHGREKKKKA